MNALVSVGRATRPLQAVAHEANIRHFVYLCIVDIGQLGCRNR